MLDFDNQWDYNNPPGTEAKFRELLATLNSAEYLGERLELQTQIARTLGLQQKFDEAHAQLDEVEKDLTPAFPIARIRYLLERGRAYNSSGQKEKARPLFVEAWDFGRTSKADFHAVDAAHMVAIAEVSENQLEWNEKAMDLAENSADERAKGWLGALYNNIGWTYHDKGQYEQALSVFEKGYTWRQEHNQIQETHIAKWCIARTQRSLGNSELALRLQKDLGQEIKQAGFPDDGFVAEEIAECLLTLDRAAEAAPYFQSAFELLNKDPWFQQNEGPRLARLKQLGDSN